MIKNFRKTYRELRRWYKLLAASSNANGIRCRIQAVYYLCIHYNLASARRLNILFRFLHNIMAHREGEFVRYLCSVSGEDIALLLRYENLGDYCIAGEMTAGIYTVPDFVPEEIFDCGANIGAFSIFAAKKFPQSKLVCFEPDAENLTLLKQNLKLNGIHAEIKECGVWNKNGLLYYHPASSITGKVSEEISYFPIPVERLNITTPKSWVKLDIEGAEYAVIPDMLAGSPLPRFLSVELHFFNQKGRPVVNALEKHNYKLKGYIDDRLECVVFDATLE
jgi:FkbM family methyltransferase